MQCFIQYYYLFLGPRQFFNLPNIPFHLYDDSCKSDDIRKLEGLSVRFPKGSTEVNLRTNLNLSLLLLLLLSPEQSTFSVEVQHRPDSSALLLINNQLLLNILYPYWKWSFCSLRPDYVSSRAGHSSECLFSLNERHPPIHPHIHAAPLAVTSRNMGRESTNTMEEKAWNKRGKMFAPIFTSKIFL